MAWKVTKEDNRHYSLFPSTVLTSAWKENKGKSTRNTEKYLNDHLKNIK